MPEVPGVVLGVQVVDMVGIEEDLVGLEEVQVVSEEEVELQEDLEISVVIMRSLARMALALEVVLEEVVGMVEDLGQILVVKVSAVDLMMVLLGRMVQRSLSRLRFPRQWREQS